MGLSRLPANAERRRPRHGDVLLRRIAFFSTCACAAIAIGTLAGILVPA